MSYGGVSGVHDGCLEVFSPLVGTEPVGELLEVLEDVCLRTSNHVHRVVSPVFVFWWHIEKRFEISLRFSWLLVILEMSVFTSQI